MSRVGRDLARLPVRAKAALVLAVVLAVGLAAWLVAGTGGGGDAADRPGDGRQAPPPTTPATGGIEVDALEGWQAIPVPDLGVGLAVPPGWEAVLLSPEGLATLANASPAVPGFVDNAHAAASAGGVLYAAGEQDGGGVSDLVVRAAPGAGVGDVDGLVAYAGELAADAGRDDPAVEVVEPAAYPTVRLPFRVGGEGEVAEATATLVAGPDDIVWSLVVTSDDPGVHDDLVAALTGTLTFADR